MVLWIWMIQRKKMHWKMSWNCDDLMGIIVYKG